MKVEQRKCARPGCTNVWIVGPRPHRTTRSKFCCVACRVAAHAHPEVMPPSQGTVSVAEAARLLSISRASAYLNIRRGFIPAVVAGRRSTRVPRAWIDGVLGTKE